METKVEAAPGSAGDSSRSSLSLVIVASSLGTVIEWYDFYIFGSLTAVLSLSSSIPPATIRYP